MEVLEVRAAKLLSARPRPFLRWAGSKRRLLPQIIPHVPASFRHYWEPFLGSGGMFFALQPSAATIGDACEPLIKTFRAVRDSPRSVLNHLSRWSVNRDTYYAVRSLAPSSRYAQAARFIYLNKTCWNGLYRVNSAGAFNVPYGRPKSDVIVDIENLEACSAFLKSTNPAIRSDDFYNVLSNVMPYDLVFLDPPYVTHHNNNGFVDYNRHLFNWDDQLRLAQVAQSLAHRGAFVMVTNAMHRNVLRLYEGFRLRVLTRPSTIASSSAKRTIVTEALLLSFKEEEGSC